MLARCGPGGGGGDRGAAVELPVLVGVPVLEDRRGGWRPRLGVQPGSAWVMTSGRGH